MNDVLTNLRRGSNRYGAVRASGPAGGRARILSGRLSGFLACNRPAGKGILCER
jgi:hypothetical protein